jgi:hypothetical protein
MMRDKKMAKFLDEPHQIKYLPTRQKNNEKKSLCDFFEPFSIKFKYLAIARTKRGVSMYTLHTR